MLSTEAQQALPHDAQVALQQVDNCMLMISTPPPLPPPQNQKCFRNRCAGCGQLCIYCD